MDQVLGMWQTFLLSMSRVGAMVSLVPVLGGRTMPMPIKVLVTITLAIFCIYACGLQGTAVRLTPGWFGALLFKEMLIGFLIGFTIVVVLAACQSAGDFMGFQMMFTAASTFMAYTEERTTVISNFYYIFAVLVFVTIDGHHWLIKAIMKSFELIPLLAFPKSFGSLGAWVGFFGQLFKVGLHLALPLMGTLLITNIMLGMVARTMPQLNVFIVGLPVQIMVGILMMVVMCSAMLIAETAFFRHWARDLLVLLHVMAVR